MLIGYNTNVTHKGKTYHVQTEDSGPSKHTLVTLLYHEGAILRSKKTTYAGIIGLPDFKERLKDLMKEQHKEMLKELIAGESSGEPALEDQAAPPSAVEDGEIRHLSENTVKKEDAEESETVQGRKKSLDEILLEHISRKVRDR